MFFRVGATAAAIAMSMMAQETALDHFEKKIRPVLASRCYACHSSAANPVKNNGFIRAYKDDLLRRTHKIDRDQIGEVMQCYAPSQLPTINQLAKEFCLCDHWFCDVTIRSPIDR